MAHFSGSSETQDAALINKKRYAGKSSRSMRARRRKGNAGSGRSMAGQLLGLSMFIMLLAFFIVLNAISSFEDQKVDPIMQSLGYAFASRMMDQPVDEQPSQRESEQQSINEGDTVARLQALFTAQIPSYKISLDRKGEMHVRVSYDALESAVMAVGQQNALGRDDLSFGKDFFLPTLVALLQDEQAGTPYRMDMLLNLKGNPAAVQNDDPQDIQIYRTRITKISERLQEAGLPVRMMSAGLKQGPENMVDIHFRPHVPYNPVADRKAP